METDVGAGVESPLNRSVGLPRAQPTLRISLLGSLSVSRDGVPIELPGSRKVRALLGFLALSSSPVSRSRICELLWDVPNDPRSELRWCLSKLRRVLNDASRTRVVTSPPDRIALELHDCSVDAIEVERMAKSGFDNVDDAELRASSELFGGTLLEGLELEGHAAFGAWLTAQRHKFQALQIASLQELTRRAPPGSDQTLRFLHAWLTLAPFDPRAHEGMLRALSQSGRSRDADEYLAQTIRSFEQEGLDWTRLREALQAIRTLRPTMIESGDEPRSVMLTQRRRASVAIMPFVDTTAGPHERGRLGDALTEDVITALAKLRVLFVIARGTVNALHDRNIGAHEAGRILNVEYVVSGLIRRFGERVSIVIEVAETEASRIVWSDELTCTACDTFSAVSTTIDRIVASIAEEIEAAEVQRAVLKPPNSLDAWESYHRGLWHMYKFDREDNQQAERFLRASIELDRTFARAHAALSFTHFQNAFLDWAGDREQQIERAFDAAAASVIADDRDPAAHWAMGRALWLRGAVPDSLTELRRSVDLSPNFALGHYTLGFVHSQSGDPRAAIEATDYSRQLSPFDPLQFAMLATRALAHVRLGEFDEAAEWALRGAAKPTAHAHILAIASVCLALADRIDEARSFVARIRLRVPNYSVEHLLRGFRFEPEAERLLRRCARSIGFD